MVGGLLILLVIVLIGGKDVYKHGQHVLSLGHAGNVRHVNQLVVKAEADNADENLIVFI